MTWFKVDDRFESSPKVMGLSLSAVGLWTLAGAWSAGQLTDGVIPKQFVKRYDAEQEANELVESGLWEDAGDNFAFHDWGDYNPTQEEVERLRKKRSRAGKKGGNTRVARQAKAQANAKQMLEQASSKTEASGQTNAKQVPDARLDNAQAKSNPDPTRPDISITSKEVIRSEFADTDQKPKKPGNTPAPKPEPEVREDVKAVIEAFQASLDARGVKRGRVTKAWRDAARLMLDRDRRTVEQVQRCCQWLAQDPFWRKNVLALPKLREQYDRLRLAAESERTPRNRLAVQDDEYAWLDARGGIAS